MKLVDMNVLAPYHLWLDSLYMPARSATLELLKDQPDCNQVHKPTAPRITCSVLEPDNARNSMLHHALFNGLDYDAYRS